MTVFWNAGYKRYPTTIYKIIISQGNSTIEKKLNQKKNQYCTLN